jgi:hypothetical protein
VRVKGERRPADTFQGQSGTETETQQAVNGNYRLPEDNQAHFRAWKPLLDSREAASMGRLAGE